MIRSDGIYIAEPFEAIDSRNKSNNSSYWFNASLFLTDSSVHRVSKDGTIENLSDYKRSDFDESKSSKRRYSLENRKIILHSRYYYERDIIIEIKNSNELYNQYTKKSLFFISWEEIENSKGVFLIDFLNRFDRDKLEKKHM
jgi:hypothetical protein